MSSKKIILIVVLGISVQCFSQETDKLDVTNVTKFTFFAPGFSYEGRVGKFQTLSAHAMINGSVSVSYSDALGNSASIYLNLQSASNTATIIMESAARNEEREPK
jgi:hypothetical protein